MKLLLAAFASSTAFAQDFGEGEVCLCAVPPATAIAVQPQLAVVANLAADETGFHCKWPFRTASWSLGLFSGQPNS